MATPSPHPAVPGGVASFVASSRGLRMKAPRPVSPANRTSGATCRLASPTPDRACRRLMPTTRAAEQVASLGGATPARSPGLDPARSVRRRPAGVAPPKLASHAKSLDGLATGTDWVVDSGQHAIDCGAALAIVKARRCAPPARRAAAALTIPRRRPQMGSCVLGRRSLWHTRATRDDVSGQVSTKPTTRQQRDRLFSGSAVPKCRRTMV